MKIIQLIQKPQLRGAEIFASQLSQELTSQGIEVILVTVFDGDAVLPFTGRIVSMNGSKATRFWDWRAWKKLTSLINKEKPDVIQANAGDTLKYAVISKLMFRWKTPIVFRNASTVSLYVKHPVAKWWNAFLYSRTSHVISVSNYTKTDFLKVFPHAAAKISVAPIGIVLGKTTTEKSRSSAGPILLHVGGFTFEKNHRGLIRIFERFRSNYPEALLYLVGDGPLRVDIERLVREKSMESCVKFFGFQSDTSTFFQSADVFLLPSIIEGLPAVILEAFYNRIPVVAYNTGAVGELVNAGHTGWLVNKGDEDEFVAAVQRAFENKHSGEILDSAYDLVTSRYGIHHITKYFIEVYTRFLS